MAELMEFSRGHRILLNVEATSVDLAGQANDLWPERILVAVVAKRFDSVEASVEHARALRERGVRASAGLGDGAADQWRNALDLALGAKPDHLNQVFPAAGLSQEALRSSGAETLVNALVRPCGVPGRVLVGTGPLSQEHAASSLPVEIALDMLLEVGVKSIKFFPMRGRERLEEFRALAREAAKREMMVEPTGGIGIDDIDDLLDVCEAENVPVVMLHLYGSLKNAVTRDIDLTKLRPVVQKLQRRGR